MIRLMREHGIVGWRRNRPLPGKPDFVFPKQRVVVFVDGCFWHKCPRCFRKPATNAEFWETKINRNVARDREVNRELKKRHWRVLRFWEHDLKSNSKAVSGRIARRLRRALDEGG